MDRNSRTRSSRFSAFWHNGRGNIAMLSAMMMTFIAMLAAFGVDEGSIYFDRRTLQGNTDVAAIVAANNLSRATVAATMSLQDNGALPASTSAPTTEADGSASGSQPSVTVQIGRYSPDPNLDVDQRFQPASINVNAARVTVLKPSTLYFASFFAKAPVIETTAIAHQQALASFSVGSRLASLNGGVLNGILSGVLGTNLTLSVMDYTALANTRVDVLPMLDAVGGQLGITAGTYDSLLANTISYSDLAHVLGRVGNISASVSNTLGNISRQTQSSNVKVPLSSLFDLGDVGNLQMGQAHNGVQLSANVLDMLSASAMLGGQHQVALNLGATIPGLTQTSLSLTIGEPPKNSGWLTVGEAGMMIYTAQTRLNLVAQVGGTGLLSGLKIRLPLYVDVAAAQGSLQSVQCTASNTPLSASVAVQPGIAGLWIGDVDTAQMQDMSQSANVAPAQLINAPLLKVMGSAHVVMGDQTSTTVAFTSTEIVSHTVKTVSTSNFTSSLTSSLLGNLNLNVNAAGLGLSTNAITGALNLALAPVTPALDQVLYNTLSLLGVKVGQADVWINGTDCASAVLVQ